MKIELDKSFEDMICNEPDMFRVLIYLLLKADASGVVMCSVLSLSDRLTISRQRLRTILKKLVQCGEVEITRITNEATNRATNKGIVIKICKTDLYFSRRSGEQPMQQPIEQPTQKETKETEINKEKEIPPHTPYKEKEINKEKENKEKFAADDARVREKREKFKQDILANIIMKEPMCMQLGITVDEFDKLAGFVFLDWEFCNMPIERWTVYHFLNTLRIKAREQKRQNNGNGWTTNSTESERQRAEYLQRRAEFARFAEQHLAGGTNDAENLRR